MPNEPTTRLFFIYFFVSVLVLSYIFSHLFLLLSFVFWATFYRWGEGQGPFPRPSYAFFLFFLICSSGCLMSCSRLLIWNVRNVLQEKRVCVVHDLMYTTFTSFSFHLSGMHI